MKNKLKIVSFFLLLLLVFGKFTLLTACSKKESMTEAWLMKAEFDREDIDEERIRQTVNALDPNEYTVTEVKEENKVIICKRSEKKTDFFAMEIWFFSTVKEAQEYYKYLYDLGEWPPCYTETYVRNNEVVFKGQGILSKKFMEDLGFVVPQSEWLSKEKYLQKIPDDIALDSIVQYMKSHGYCVTKPYAHGEYFAISIYDGEKPMRSFLIDISLKPEQWANFQDNINFSVFYNSEYTVYCMSNQWLKLLEEVRSWLGESAK